MRTLPCPQGGVFGLTFSPDGDMLAGIGYGDFGTRLADRRLYCWIRSQGWKQITIPHCGISNAVFHPGGRTLAYCHEQDPERIAAGEFTGVRLYPLTSVSQFESDQLLAEPVSAPLISLDVQSWRQQVAFTPDGQTLLANRIEAPERSAVVSIIHWHFIPSGDRLRVIKATPGRTVVARGAALVGTNSLALAGSWDIKVCPLAPTASQLFVPEVPEYARFAVAPCQELIAVEADNQQLRVWHLREAKSVATISVPGLWTMAFSPDARTLATGDANHTVTFWDPLTGRPRSAYDFGVGQISSLAYAPDGLTLAVAGYDGLVVVDVG